MLWWREQGQYVQDRFHCVRIGAKFLKLIGVNAH